MSEMINFMCHNSTEKISGCVETIDTATNRDRQISDFCIMCNSRSPNFTSILAV